MKQVTFIVGLPGSGKTTLAKSLADESSYILDDFYPGLINEYNESVIEKANKIFVTSPELCSEKIRDTALAYLKTFSFLEDALFNWIYFESDLHQCLKNLKLRAHQEAENTLYLYNQFYKPPGNAIPVWRPN